MKIFKFSATAMFAEDIRDETGGTQTIVGIFPDNLAVPSFPGVIPKLAIYSRITFDPALPPRNLQIHCAFENGSEVATDTFDPEMMEESVSGTKQKGGPIATVLSKIILAGLVITGAGRLQAVVRHDGGEFLAGSLNIELAPPAV